MSDRQCFLLDVNLLVALTYRSHVHHTLAKEWFYASPERSWSLCAFTEAGFLRNAAAPRPGQISLQEATRVLKQLASHPGYRYFPVNADWESLTAPFSRRLYGTKQVTDAYLLGLAIRENLTLVTMDKAILHLAGDNHRERVLLLRNAETT